MAIFQSLIFVELGMHKGTLDFPRTADPRRPQDGLKLNFGKAKKSQHTLSAAFVSSFGGCKAPPKTHWVTSLLGNTNT